MLDKKTIAELKEKLLAEKERLEKNLVQSGGDKPGADREYQTAFSEIERDQEENADEMELYESTLSANETLKSELKKIDAAISAIDAVTYGRCRNCGKEIPLERLRAYPQADTCIDCEK